MNAKLVHEPTVIVVAKMELDWDGLNQMVEWLATYRPECLPDYTATGYDLFPHDLTEDVAEGVSRTLTDNELLAELAGRSCYHSYGRKAGRRTNSEYIQNMLERDIPHASVAYHAKMTFFIAGVSRRVSHELIRHYVGADRDEEGSPSQESTRYTEHPGHFAVPPRVIDDGMQGDFAMRMTLGYQAYRDYLALATKNYREQHGVNPKGLERKRIYEAAAGLLPMQACTSLVWTTNPVALAKLLKERANEGADREFQRLAYKWKDIVLERWPNVMKPLLGQTDS